jgi:hypothetical protein
VFGCWDYFPRPYLSSPGIPACRSLHRTAAANSSWAASVAALLQDAAAYMAGERAALTRAFRDALPSQRALGGLSGAVSRIDVRLGEEAGHVRGLQGAAAQLAAAVKVRRTHGRLVQKP